MQGLVTKAQKQAKLDFLLNCETQIKSMFGDFKEYPDSENPYTNHFKKTIESLEFFFVAYGGVNLKLLSEALKLKGIDFDLNIKLLEKSGYTYNPPLRSKEYKYSSIEYGFVISSTENNTSFSVDNILSYNKITEFVPDKKREPLFIDNVVKNAIDTLDKNKPDYEGDGCNFEGGLWGWHSRD